MSTPIDPGVSNNESDIGYTDITTNAPILDLLLIEKSSKQPKKLGF